MTHDITVFQVLALIAEVTAIAWFLSNTPRDHRSPTSAALSTPPPRTTDATAPGARMRPAERAG